MYQFKMKNKFRKDGKLNMCQGLREWMEDERNEGREEGETRANPLIIMLTEQSRSEDLVRAAKDSAYRETLFKELKI